MNLFKKNQLHPDFQLWYHQSGSLVASHSGVDGNLEVDRIFLPGFFCAVVCPQFSWSLKFPLLIMLNHLLRKFKQEPQF